MSVGLDDWYREMWERSIRIEAKLDELLGKNPFLEGLGDYATEEEAEDYEAYEDPMVIEETPTTLPRAKVKVKGSEGQEKLVPFSDLPADVQRGVSMARSMDQMYQVYEGAEGDYRLATTREVVDRMNRES